MLRTSIGDGVEAAGLVRRYQKLFPEDAPVVNGEVEETSPADAFAWDAYQRMEELDKLANEFPAHIRRVARLMHGWPMLCRRHTNNRRRFQELAQRLQLGADTRLMSARARASAPTRRWSAISTP